MIHIVFNESEIELMQKVGELEPTLAGDVWQIRDDFAVGPLAALDTEEGWAARNAWWKGLLENSPYDPAITSEIDDRKTVQELIDRLTENPDEQIWIWMGQNQHDVCGYYWLMPQLRAFQGRVMILYMNNLPFINEKGQLFYPSWLHEIQPKELIKARILCRPITLSEFEVDPDEWKKLVEENATVRMLEGGKKIAGKGEDFYDAELVKNVTADWQKATRVLTNTLNRMKIKTGDVFLMWRMKELIKNGRLEVSGDTGKTWKDFDIRLAGSNKTESPATEEATA
ncbi:MAG: DUF1835 domain-containing protein [Chitinophagaceae bacterium]|jgi:hypothetical protein|nr:DUF1835 domain-containing protein [Chitinophagaceae bacterium]